MHLFTVCTGLLYALAPVSLGTAHSSGTGGSVCACGISRLSEEQQKSSHAGHAIPCTPCNPCKTMKRATQPMPKASILWGVGFGLLGT